jgi:2-polyprenyl-6-methoxyphenol hydroxylase-like FAD-dependent oxidoreductase
VRATLAGADAERTVVNTILEPRRPRELVKDRYVLVGDAAHAMSPNLGRGACEAPADAVVRVAPRWA